MINRFLAEIVFIGVRNSKSSETELKIVKRAYFNTNVIINEFLIHFMLLKY